MIYMYINLAYVARTVPLSSTSVSITIVGNFNSKIILQKSAIVWGIGPICIYHCFSAKLIKCHTLWCNICFSLLNTLNKKIE